MAYLERNYWRNATRQNPCQICGSPRWCSVSIDGAVVSCRWDDSGRHKVDKNGDPYYVHRLDGSWPIDSEIPPMPEEAERAEIEILDKVYTALLERLTLFKTDEQHLKEERMLSHKAIVRHGLRSMPNKPWQVAKELVRRFGPEVCKKVPGIYLQKKVRDYWTLGSVPGIVIPGRDLQGRIFALLVRPL